MTVAAVVVAAAVARALIEAEGLEAHLEGSRVRLMVRAMAAGACGRGRVRGAGAFVRLAT